MRSDTTASSTEERRAKVSQLHARGLPGTAIAEVLGINRKTVGRDLKLLGQRARQDALAIDRFEVVGQAMKFYDEIEHEAMFGFHEAEAHSAKIAYLSTAMAAREKKIKLMMQAGIIERAASSVDVVMDVAKLSWEGLVRMAHAILGAGVPGPSSPGTIPATLSPAPSIPLPAAHLNGVLPKVPVPTGHSALV